MTTYEITSIEAATGTVVITIPDEGPQTICDAPLDKGEDALIKFLDEYMRQHEAAAILHSVPDELIQLVGVTRSVPVEIKDEEKADDKVDEIKAEEAAAIEESIHE